MAFLRWFYESGDALSPADVEARWHPEMTLIQSPEMPGTAGEFRGYDGLRAVNAEIGESFPKIHWNPQDATELPDGRFLVSLEPTVETSHGLTLDQTVIGGWLGHLITMHEDGRVLRLETYLDQDKARAAAGLG